MKNVKILGVTLLSAEEAETLLTREERKYNYCWWLRSPGYYSNFTCYVYNSGDVHSSGRSVDFYSGVRPALNIDISSSNIKTGDVFNYGGKEFKVISDSLAWMHNSDIGCYAFRKEWQVKNANEYEASDVKKFIDKWFSLATPDEKPKTIYYGHHQYKYGTAVEEYELKIIKKYFENRSIRIINPPVDIDQNRPDAEVMADCLDAVKSCDVLVFSSLCGVIGKGLYTEIKTARDNGIPVYEIYGNTLNPADNITFKLLRSDTPREYAVYKVFKGGPV